MVWLLEFSAVQSKTTQSGISVSSNQLTAIRNVYCVFREGTKEDCDLIFFFSATAVETFKSLYLEPSGKQNRTKKPSAARTYTLVENMPLSSSRLEDAYLK